MEVLSRINWFWNQHDYDKFSSWITTELSGYDTDYWYDCGTIDSNTWNTAPRGRTNDNQISIYRIGGWRWLEVKLLTYFTHVITSQLPYRTHVKVRQFCPACKCIGPKNCLPYFIIITLTRTGVTRFKLSEFFATISVGRLKFDINHHNNATFQSPGVPIWPHGVQCTSIFLLYQNNRS